MKHDHTLFADAIAQTPRAVVEDRVRRFVPLVRRTAWHVHGMASTLSHAGIDIDDLIQTGLIALMECARRHGPAPDDGFAAYAKLRVRGAMVDLIRRSALESRGAVRRRQAYDAATARLTAHSGAAPTAAQLCAELGCSADDLRRIERGQTHFVALDDSFGDSDPALADDRPDAFAQLAEASDRARLTSALAALPERLQRVLQLFFVEELNLTEIAAVLDVSVPRVHQLRAQALGKLRAMLSDIRD